MAMILDAFVGICLEKLAVIVEEKATTVMGAKDELQKLQRRLGKIHMALEDAERRRLENAAINLWVLELKDILYDADDIIDLCLVKSPHLLSDGGDRLSSFSPTVCCHFLKFLCCFTSLSDRYAIGKGIQNLNERLKEIYEEKGIFDCVPKKPIIEKTLVNIGDTSPMLKFVVGRAIKEATKKLVEEMSFGFNEKKSYRVFAITGMSGIGKTTLAQRIFNNDKMKSYFQIKSWVCVSPTYSEIELLKQIIRDASGVYGDAKTKSELLPILGSALAGKSLFLVLDDVWRADVWIELLQNPIQMAGIEARILITTRDVNIAKLMRSFYIHPVTQLPDETGWEMLCRILFQEEQTEDMHRLREIGIKIVKKCHGLPLAIKAIAGVLSKREPNNKEWEEVLSRDAWSNSNLPEELRGPLYLSYDDLPSPLKQCFLYCSLWTEDWIIGREDLIRMWIAEGFIKVNGGDSTLMEDTGMDYYNELIRRNLLQLDPRFVDGSICSMHDMLRSLAEFLCEGERPRNFHGRNDKSSTKVRRMIISRPSELPNGQGDPTLQNRYLRTLICLDGAQFKGASRCFSYYPLEDCTIRDTQSINASYDHYLQNGWAEEVLEDLINKSSDITVEELKQLFLQMHPTPCLWRVFLQAVHVEKCLMFFALLWVSTMSNL
ncbi:hypothetical protein HPP92_025591 [Vanilla planifolia]|uniref:Disease resistance protein RGA3 n=1 Tax=Vanilla planifolia TaxID=51239 RepID=A0A835PQE2_VANPL|nr:hypothetical protein HPP92_025591 [Vanilla planifolia]